MAIVDHYTFEPIADESDPDDYRPNSKLAIVMDPTRNSSNVVQSMSVIFEHVSAGDAIPLHVHTVDEAIFIDEGRGDVTLGSERKVVGSGAVVFIPAGTPHGTRNIGDQVLRLHAVFPTPLITIRYLARNPWPGTEGDSPQPAIALDVRELLEGDPAKAFQYL